MKSKWIAATVDLCHACGCDFHPVNAAGICEHCHHSSRHPAARESRRDFSDENEAQERIENAVGGPL